jgi:hypothetical protein
MLITTYWNIDGEYEIKNRYMIEGDFSSLKSRYKHHPRMTIYHNKIIEDLGKDDKYGVHSYIEITNEDLI